jgi:hypothetical protein
MGVFRRVFPRRFIRGRRIFPPPTRARGDLAAAVKGEVVQAGARALYTHASFFSPGRLRDVREGSFLEHRPPDRDRIVGGWPR